MQYIVGLYIYIYIYIWQIDALIPSVQASKANQTYTSIMITCEHSYLFAGIYR